MILTFKISSLALKAISSTQLALQNVLMLNGLSIQELLIEANAEIAFAEVCFAEYFQIFLEQVGIHI